MELQNKRIPDSEKIKAAPRLNAETFVTPLKKSAQDDWNSIWL